MDTQQGTNTSRTKNRGFASMDTHRQREIARKGGRAAHEKGKAHEFTADEARAAGRKGGEKVSVNRRHMAEIGRRGGRSSAARRRPGGDGGAGMATHEPRGAEHATPSQQQPAVAAAPLQHESAAPNSSGADTTSSPQTTGGGAA